MILRLWHGLRLHKWLVFKVRVQRTGARVGGRSFAEFQRCSSHVQESQSARRRGEGAPLARRFKQSVFWTSLKAAGPIRASVRGGAPPARLVFAKHFFM